MNRFVASQVVQLKVLKKRNVTNATTQATKKRIDQIIKLYTDRKIAKISTAESMIKGLTSTDKKVYDKTFQKYKDNIDKWKGANTLSQRFSEAKKRREKKTFFVEYVLYDYYTGDMRESTIKTRKAFTHLGVTYFPISFKATTATIKASEFPRDAVGKKTFRWINPEDVGSGINENPKYVNIIQLLKTDDEFRDMFDTLTEHYDKFACIKIKSVELVDKDGKHFDIMTENLTDASNVSIFHNYISTPMRMEASTIKEAIMKGHYIEGLCWVNALIDFYGDTIMSEKCRKRLTVDRIKEIIGKNDFDVMGASITDMEKVFKVYGIQVRIFNFCNQLIYKHDPEKISHHRKVFYAMVKNNHIYVLNHDLKSIQQKQIMTKIPVVRASPDYYIKEVEEPPQYKMIRDVDEILQIKVEKGVNEVNLIVEDNNLIKVFFKLVRSGYEPRIRWKGAINEIKMKFNKVTFKIRTQNLLTTSCDGSITVGNEKTFNTMSLAFYNFHKSVFNPIHKSFYSDLDLKILNESKTIVPSGLIYPADVMRQLKKEKAKMTEIDITKAFTSAFLKMFVIASFCQFDIWKPYDGRINEHNELTMYYVKNLNFDKNRYMLNKEYCMMYGCILKQVIHEIDVEIIAYKVPYQKHKVDYKTIIDNLWQMLISDDAQEDKYIKKLIANVIIGLLEKGGATDQKSLLFKNLGEAMSYQAEYGGRLYKLSDIEVDDEWIEEEKQKYYVLNLKDTVELKNGFRFIKEMLLQIHNLEMFKAYSKLSNNNIPCYSVKTDAFVIDSNYLEKAKKVLNFHSGIGGWRADKKDDEIILPTVEYEVVKNERVDIPTYECKELIVKDEYDTDNIIEEHIERGKPIMIRGELPGTGKSFICQRMVEKGYNVIFVCPTNKLLQSFEGEAVTVHKFFGIGFATVKLDEFDFSEFDAIVFDEIYFSNLNVYSKMKGFVEKNTDKIIIATGDCMQLKPVQELTNTKDYHEYANEIIDNIFPYKINLKICKRLNNEGDRNKLKNIMDDIFVNKLPINKIIDKYFSYTDDIRGSTNNIAFLNNTCKNVSSEIRKLENRKDEYEVGEQIICREYTTTDTSVFNVNFEYKIVHIGDGILTLKNIKTGILQSIGIDKVRSNFIFASCSTCHSAQGSSIDGDLTIFDYNHPLIRNYREFLWTAITRARDLSKVKFFKYSDDTEDEFNKQNIISYFNRKIENYKLQDRKAKREIPKDGYVNTKWFMENVTNQCNYCGCGFTLDIKRGSIYTNLTCQRKCNELPHSLENIIPYCRRCNCSCK